MPTLRRLAVFRRGAMLIALVAAILTSALTVFPAEALPPFTPTFTYTFDEVAPDDPDILPVDDECPVGAPCKFMSWLDIPDGQPLSAISLLVDPPSIVAFADAAVVPDGAIVGKASGSVRYGPVGSCATGGTMTSFSYTAFAATIDASTTTGAPSDLSSFSNWPTQLDGVRDDFLTTHPGSVLTARSMSSTFLIVMIFNRLYFTQPDGSTAIMLVDGDPTEAPPPRDTELCSPLNAKNILLGVSADNPNTPEDEGGIPMQTCIAAGTHTITASLDRNDTPPGDPVVLEDTAICSPNTAAGTGVPVSLNGGTGLLGGIDVTFSGVSGGGSTSVVTTTTGPPPPTGFRIVGLAGLPLYFDINTDSSYSGALTICIRYDETQVAGPEANLRLMHRVDGFVDITTSIDTASNVICGTTTSFSVFAVMEAEPEPEPVGGISLGPELAGLPLETPGSSGGGNVGVLVGIAAGAAGAVLVVGGAAWLVRRLRVR